MQEGLSSNWTDIYACFVAVQAERSRQQACVDPVDELPNGEAIVTRCSFYSLTRL